jgi:tol-pal system protein YbgF
VVNRVATDREREAGPPEAYVKAFGLFSANSFSEAISAFEAFLLSNPSSEYAGNSHFWIGECHYAQKEYRKAITSFQRVVEHYPASAKVPDAMLRIASCHSSLKEAQRARQVMEQLVAKYPDTPAAIKARELLTRQ